LKYAGTGSLAKEIERAPLPPFDAVVLNRLKSNEPEIVWNLMLRQAAAYYYGNWPGIDDSSVYRVIGQKMLAQYPSVKQEGANSWASRNQFMT